MFQKSRDFPGHPVVNTQPMYRARDQSLVRELRSHMLHGVAKKKKKVKNKVSEKRRKERGKERGVGKRENRQAQVLTRRHVTS